VGVRSAPRERGAPIALPAALVLTGAVSVQAGAGIAARLFDQVPPAAVTALRLWAAALIMLAVGGRGAARAVAGLARRRAWRDAAATCAFGIALAFMNFAIYQAFARIPLGIAVTIEFLGPLAVALAGSRRWLDAFWALLAAGGVVLLMEGRGDLNLVGFLFALAAGTCWGLYILIGAALGRHTTKGNGLALGMTVAALVAVPIGVAGSGTALIRPRVLVAGLGVAMLSSVIPYSLDLEALRKIPPRVFGILMSLEPAMAALIGLIVLQESLRWSQWMAVLCVVAASAGATRGAHAEV